MKNNRTAFLSYVTVVITILICTIQIYILMENAVMSSPNLILQWSGLSYRAHVIVLILGITAITIFFLQQSFHRVLKRNAYIDITGIMNKHACLEQMSRLDCRDSTLNIGLAMFDLNNLKKVNDFYGHEKGDRLIQEFVTLLRQSTDKKCFLGRFGGDEFIVIIQNCNEQIMEALLQRMRGAVEANNKLSDIHISYAQGYAISTKDHYYLMDEILQEADKKMYENKRMMKSRNLLEIDQISKVLDPNRLGNGERDDLTGMLGYDAFIATIEKVLKIYKKNTRLALVCTGVNNFRYLNDLYGHKEGNNILKLLAEELRKESFCLCSCRLYSDNFAFLADMSQYTETQAKETIRLLNAQFSTLVEQTHSRSRLILKSGIYFITNLNEPVESMLKYADCARIFSTPPYDNIVVFSHKLNQSVKKRSEIINSFQTALANEEFEIFIQPKILRSNKCICSGEALIRWKKSDGSFLSPNTFVPILEQSGDIIEMDYYVYEQVFSYLYKNQLASKIAIPISLNVSRMHLYTIDSFMERIRQIHDQYPIPTSLITFELTESAYIQEIDSAEQLIHRLHQMGYWVSMDDFGNGYSSLKALCPMIFDEIKFDRAFLKTNISPKEANLLLQLIKLVKSLNTAVVCEGVETAENVSLLNQSACDVFQGYYFYKPFPLKELESVYLSQRPSSSFSA